MKKITTISKALEFLVNNQKGHFNDLKNINYDIIKVLENSNCLIINVDKYQVTSKGIDYYCQNYVQENTNKKRFLGIFPRFSMLFR